MSGNKHHLSKVANHGMNNGCVVCKEPYSELHHILEGRTPGRKSDDWLTIPLCYECHRGTHGIHGTRNRWKSAKASELSLLASVLKSIYGSRL
jgi:hypothetical protein